jgi:hypothetical protein
LWFLCSLSSVQIFHPTKAIETFHKSGFTTKCGLFTKAFHGLWFLWTSMMCIIQGCLWFFVTIDNGQFKKMGLWFFVSFGDRQNLGTLFFFGEF